MKPTEVDINIHSISKEDLTKYELIDIREPAEILDWPPLRPCKQIPFSQFPANIDQFDKNKSYLLFCAKGGRSHFMAEDLLNQGFKALSVNHGIPSVNSYFKNLEE
jgi:rhodanese-related sulfurtransferase